MSDENSAPEGQPGIPAAALQGLCPRCGSKTLFAGVARFADNCTNCGLDFTKFNVGDGPAAFLTLIIGTLVTIVGIVVDQAAHPPLLVTIGALIPITAAAVIYGLRLAKAALLSAEFQRKAGEAGRKE